MGWDYGPLGVWCREHRQACTVCILIKFVWFRFVLRRSPVFVTAAHKQTHIIEDANYI